MPETLFNTTKHYISKILEKPMQVRLPGDLRKKIARIAEVNRLSEADVIRLCLAQTVPSIEENGITIIPPPKKAA